MVSDSLGGDAAVTRDARAVPLLETRGIRKSFPGVLALRGVDLLVHSGEVLALMGENGAGKSTLIKVLSGAHQPDEGAILLEGNPVEITSPQTAEKLGIAVIYQEFNLVPGLDAVDNIFLGKERSRGGLILRRREETEAKALFQRLGVSLPLRAPSSTLSVAQQQLVEIAKALSSSARVLIMDEPTAALTGGEVERLFGIIEELKREGLGIVYISHRLDEIERIADRITVLRDGEQVGGAPAKEMGRERLIELMVGRKMENEFPPRRREIGPVRLRARDLKRGSAVRGVSLEIHRGEVLGLTGLVGAGRTELARLLFGADAREAGEVELDGKALDLRTPREAIRAGICLLTEDRKAEGLVLGLSIRENFGLPNLSSFRLGPFQSQRAERKAFASWGERLNIRAASPEQRAGQLSGGNQQKVVLAKWLQSHAEVIIFDEPTRGIDVGAKYEIYEWINRLALEGKAILMISSELPEVLGVADRILVMREGLVAGELLNEPGVTQESLVKLAMGS